MGTARFDWLYRCLVGAFRQYHDTPRDPETVTELGAARWRLELARKEIAVERQRIEAERRAAAASPSRTAVSDDDQARLRVSGMGLIS